MTSRETAFKAISEERNYQDRKWGKVTDRPHSVGEWILIAEAELQEAKHAWTKECSDQHALEELLQTAAVIVAALEQHRVSISYIWEDLAEGEEPRIQHFNDVGKAVRHYGLSLPSD